MNPNYNRIAFIYDKLASFVFGETLENAKREYLSTIKDHDRILIVGGGTGSLLTYLSQMNLSLSVDFVELSENMMRKAKGRSQPNLDTRYYSMDIMEFPGMAYDLIICNFFFDQFSLEKGTTLLNQLYSKLNSNGHLIYSDFQPDGKWPIQILIKMMYWFFRNTANLNKVTLADAKVLFNGTQFNLVSAQWLNCNILISIYRK